jgi:hypothetical protein
VSYHEFQTPIPVRVIDGPGKWPVGKAAAYGFWKKHLDYHVTWHVAFDQGGAFWEIENPFVRADPNRTWGRTLEGEENATASKEARGDLEAAKAADVRPGGVR